MKKMIKGKENWNVAKRSVDAVHMILGSDDIRTTEDYWQESFRDALKIKPKVNKTHPQLKKLLNKQKLSTTFYTRFWVNSLFKTNWRFDFQVIQDSRTFDNNSITIKLLPSAKVLKGKETFETLPMTLPLHTTLLLPRKALNFWQEVRSWIKWLI